jgi:hypothetical protein
MVRLDTPRSARPSLQQSTCGYAPPYVVRTATLEMVAPPAATNTIDTPFTMPLEKVRTPIGVLPVVALL